MTFVNDDVCSKCGNPRWLHRDDGLDLCPPPPAPMPSDVKPPKEDLVNHPKHYTSHPSGIECIQITEHMSFNVGNAVKYLWRADEKGAPIQDLEKARWYIDREIARRKASA